jgi:putative hydrolase of the HAD superfamily
MSPRFRTRCLEPKKGVPVMYENIKRVFFDSGKVLVHPSSGNWYFTDRYFDYCKKNDIKHHPFITNLIMPFAIKYLESETEILDIDYEYAVFTRFYKMFFFYYPGRVKDELANVCADSKVVDTNRYLLYDDVLATIEALSGKYKLGLISDAWPSLVSVYEANKLHSSFSPFIISSIYGCVKKDGALFKVALSQIDEKPNECLFIDDSRINCIQAKRLGMEAILLNREDATTDSYISTIHDLGRLKELLPL